MIFRCAPGLYRSALPSKADLRTFAAAGGRVVIDLTQRPRPNVERWCSSLALSYLKRPLRHEFSEKEVSAAADAVRSASGPVLLHCFHGRDRTGAVVDALVPFRVALANVHRNIDRAIRTGWSFGVRRFDLHNCASPTERSQAASARTIVVDAAPHGESTVVLCPRGGRSIQSVDWSTVSCLALGGETHGYPPGPSVRVRIPTPVAFELTVDAALSAALMMRANAIDPR